MIVFFTFSDNHKTGHLFHSFMTMISSNIFTSGYVKFVYVLSAQNMSHIVYMLIVNKY